MKYFNFIVLLFCFNTYSQVHIKGKISDLNEKPLPRANIIFTPNNDGQLKVATANFLGEFELQLDKNITYTISVRYLGYLEEKKTITTHSNQEIYFKLTPNETKIDEIVIKYDFKPFEMKKDTVEFNVNKIANGNERRLKEVLEKIPGVEVDKDGSVKFHGKDVNTTTVQGKPFFGGGSKLAIENIPSDALDKIEFINNYNENTALKDVFQSNELAMNIKLKKNKQNFVFGDIEGDAEVANSNNFYRAHANLFYYSPRTSLGYIVDINTIGKNVFSLADFLRIDKGSNFLKNNKKSITNLLTFTESNLDVLSNRTQFSALNLDTDIKKVNVSGLFLFSKTLINNLTTTNFSYLQNNAFFTENRINDKINRSTLGYGNIKLKYNPNSKTNFLYQIQSQLSNGQANDNLNTNSSSLSSILNNLTVEKNIAIKHFFEFHKNLTNKHTLTFIVSQAIENSDNQNNWQTNQPFLSGLIPITNDSFYDINQDKTNKNHSIETLLKHYWSISNKNQLTTYLGFNSWNTKLITNENQKLTNGYISNFNNAGFGNNLNYQLYNYYICFENHLNWRIFKFTPSVYFQKYLLKINQKSNSEINQFFIQPEFKTEVYFEENEKIYATYKWNNTIAEAYNFLENYTLQNFNSVFKGNINLDYTTFHTATIMYYRSSFYGTKFSYNFGLNYNQKTKTLRNEIETYGIYQFLTPLITANPESTFSILASSSKRIYKFNFGINTSFTNFNYKQYFNNTSTSNSKKSYIIGAKVKTQNTKLPDIVLSYNKGFNYLSGFTKSKNTTENIKSSISFNCFKYFIYSFDYNYVSNLDNNQNKNDFQIANTSLRFQKKKKPLTLEIYINNILNTKSKNSILISDFSINETTNYILPRMVMLSLSYKI